MFDVYSSIIWVRSQSPTFYKRGISIPREVKDLQRGPQLPRGRSKSRIQVGWLADKLVFLYINPVCFIPNLYSDIWADPNNIPFLGTLQICWLMNSSVRQCIWQYNLSYDCTDDILWMWFDASTKWFQKGL